ncbi:unnamed protein product [marine sediment metagenome]|uniref:Uncharacterized protein n=1 Tax=marine sediment metagenome TaxID=412755 RepID=X1QY83_9ZZZZ
MEHKSIEYSWKWITADELLSKVACELCCLMMTSKQGPSVIHVYDGENTNGTFLGRFETLANRSQVFCPKMPIYCRRGLYIDVRENLEGVLIQWRELEHEKREG